MAKRTFERKKRKVDKLPPEKLLDIFRGIWPEEIAVKKFNEICSDKEDLNARTDLQEG